MSARIARWTKSGTTPRSFVTSSSNKPIARRPFFASRTAASGTLEHTSLDKGIRIRYGLCSSKSRQFRILGGAEPAMNLSIDRE